MQLIPPTLYDFFCCYDFIRLLRHRLLTCALHPILLYLIRARITGQPAARAQNPFL